MSEITPADIPSAPLVGKPLLYFTSIFVSLGVFLFGYDQGYCSGIIVQQSFKDYFGDPSSSTIGTIVAILEIGALISSFNSGHIGDSLGRRRTIRWGAFIFCVGGFCQSIATSVPHMIIGRFISGLGVGLLSSIVPVYQAEISPPDSRGKLGCVEFTGNIFGYTSSIWIDYAASFIEKGNLSWRIPLYVQVVFGLILWVGSFVIVESPRWLLQHDLDAEGIVVIADLYADGEVHSDHAKSEYRSIKEMVLLDRFEGDKTYFELLRRYPKRLFVAMSSQFFAQFNGINIISYYAPMVFESAGWVGRDAILMTGINGLVYILSTIPPWYLVDHWGRKPILISGGLIMGISLYAVAYFSYLKSESTPQLVVLFVIIYNAGFGYSWGPIAWLLVECCPYRAKSGALSTATNWASNFVVGQLSPILLEQIKWKLYLIPATFCIVSILTVHFVYPETKGLSLEDMDSLFDDRSSIHSSRSNSTYGATDIEAGQRFISPSQLARVPGQAETQAVASSPFIFPQDLEPPDLNAILAYKNSDTNSIRGSLRRGSEAVSSIFKGVPNKKNRDDSSSVTDDRSERFID
ncbi:hypothetical protein B5S28_g2241 [[Candida] boidinii]|nr:hypothetical protein B5S28_g2241 [[Candida] boidinii]